MVDGMRFMLLVFAMIGFAAAGAALAVTRARLLGEGERDPGLAAIGALFLLFATLCTLAASGVFGVLAFGGVTVWASYVLMGQRVGLFTIEAQPGPATEVERSETLKRR
jgi:hypothetical protein